MKKAFNWLKENLIIIIVWLILLGAGIPLIIFSFGNTFNAILFVIGCCLIGVFLIIFTRSIIAFHEKRHTENKDKIQNN